MFGFNRVPKLLASVLLTPALLPNLAPADVVFVLPKANPAPLQAGKPDSGKPESAKSRASEASSLDLRIEMIEFGADLKRSQSYRDEDLAEALKPFRATAPTPANSGEMLTKMADALAKLDPDFRKGYEPFTQGKYSEAVGIWKDQLNAAREEKSCKMAVLRYYLGEAYRLSDIADKRERLESAIFEYRSLAKLMPDKFSPAGMACYRAGQCFEELNRPMRAYEEWKQFADRYSTADEKLLKEIQPKLQQWGKDYDSLSGIIDKAAGHMGNAKTGLENKISGQPTQEEQNRSVAILDDLIQTLEEKEKEKDGGGGGGGGGGGMGMGMGMGMPGAPNGRPNAPATMSSLVEGKSTIGTLDSTAGSGRDDTWGRLPPRERERIINAIKARFPDRYNEIVREYLKGVSTDSDTPTPAPGK